MNLDTDMLKITLHSASYVPDIDSDVVLGDLDNELAGSGGYTTGGLTATNNVYVVDNTNDRAYLDMDDPAFESLTQSSAIRYGVLRSSTDSDNLIGWWDFDSNQTPNGATFIIVITAAGSGGALYIT